MKRPGNLAACYRRLIWPLVLALALAPLGGLAMPQSAAMPVGSAALADMPCHPDTGPAQAGPGNDCPHCAAQSDDACCATCGSSGFGGLPTSPERLRLARNLILLDSAGPVTTPPQPDLLGLYRPPIALPA